MKFYEMKKSFFPLLISCEGKLIVIKNPDDLPQNKPFKVIQTNFIIQK